MKKEISKLPILEDIILEKVKIVLLDKALFSAELVKYEDESLAIKYTNKKNLNHSFCVPIAYNSKLIWQKVQQQQDEKRPRISVV